MRDLRAAAPEQREDDALPPRADAASLRRRPDPGTSSPPPMRPPLSTTHQIERRRPRITHGRTVHQDAPAAATRATDASAHRLPPPVPGVFAVASYAMEAVDVQGLMARCGASSPPMATTATSTTPFRTSSPSAPEGNNAGKLDGTNVPKRIENLESMYNQLASKPAEIPEDKDQILLNSFEHIRSIEADLERTKRVLHATVAKQQSLVETLEAVQESSRLRALLKMFSSCRTST